ncbi:MAG: M1 family aminopeptidase [Candidatus Zhuqueibacterota bacterium]
MTNKLKALAFFMYFVCFPSLGTGQTVHDQIREFEAARFARNQGAFSMRAMKGEPSDIDVSYYRIDLKINPYEENISGSVYMEAISQIAGLNEISLDFFDNMIVDSVVSQGDTLGWTHSENSLNITLPQTIEIDDYIGLHVYYHGRPSAAGGFKSFDFGSHLEFPIVATLSQPFGAPAWWPCKDDPADKADSVDIAITVPDTFIVASNGVLVSKTENEDTTTTYFWSERYPISTYLVSLAITNYEVFSDYYYSGTDSMEVLYFVYPENEAAAREDFTITVEAITHFSSLFGQYPFIDEKYGMAEFQWGGAMEHQTCTSYGRGLIQGNHRYDSYLVHELAHQWFGDLITMKRWSHIWLNEGFASYAEALWAEHRGGQDSLFNYMDEFDQGLFPTSVFVYDSTNIAELFSRTVYDKGAWVLHMLRHVLGDSSFFESLAAYREAFAFGNATTEDFRDVCESVYGADLDWFFEQWVYGFFRPSYEYAWSDSEAGENHIVTLKLDQVQVYTGLFKMPLDVQLTTLSGDTTCVVWDSLASQTFQFVMDEEVIKLQIDPDNWVLKELLIKDRHNVSGTIFTGDKSTPLPDALVYFSRIDLATYMALSVDTVHSKSSGHYDISVIPGFYVVEVVKPEDGYLPAEPEYIEIDRNISGLDFVLTAPRISTGYDSLLVFLDQGENFTDTLVIENAGNGQLLFSVAPILSGGMLKSPASYATLSPLAPGLKIPLGELPDMSGLRQGAASAPTGSWQLVYKDPEDNPAGVMDLSETWMQISGGKLYFKVSSFYQYAQLNQLEYDLLIDTDGNPDTGIFAGWLGGDYVVVVTDFGGVFSALARYTGSGFELVTLASYENMDAANNEFTTAFPLTSFGSAKVLSMISVVQSLTNPLLDQDVAPNNNFGYFIFSLEEIPWLHIEPNFGLVEASQPGSVIITILPGALSAGHYHANLVIANNEATNMKKIVPIRLDYITSVADQETVPGSFALFQNYPNPFNSKTQIRYDLPAKGFVTLDIYNLLGQKVRRLVEKSQPAGIYTVSWDGLDHLGRPAGNGVYFYVIAMDDKTLPARKMVVLK